VRRYHVALQVRGFVILAGVSGTGKTWLTRAYASAVKAKYLLVPVAPNWTSNEDLLGYFNPVTGKYVDTAVSRFLREAMLEYRQISDSDTTARPYHLVLDEMNLARVEHYFAKFLSALEVRQRDSVADLELHAGEVLQLAPNLSFIGTVNVDETTHGFSDKVYDRAQLLELPAPREHLAAHVANEACGEMLMKIWDAVSPVAPFAFRVLDDVADYVERSVELDVDWKEALDEQIV
jgi:MoxR-like ATPase